MLPKGRTILYSEYKAAERAGLSFPGVNKSNWDDLDWWTQLHLIAYDQIRELETLE